MIRVTHVITGLQLGGAELMLHRLVRSLDRERFECRVVSLTSDGPVGRLLAELDVEVHSLGGRRDVLDARVIPRMARDLERWRPNVVQTWMYHANLAGGVAARLRRIPVAWNLRQTPPDAAFTGRSTMLAVRAGTILSRVVPTRVVCCSAAVALAHRELGYPGHLLEVVPNGYDTDLLHPDPGARSDVRRELGIPPEAALVGLIARYHPQKGHADFLQAARQVDTSLRRVDFLLAGEGVTSDNSDLMRTVEQSELVDRAHLLGPRLDVARLTASLDVAVSASTFGEGFPNAIAEAMACSVPVVATSLAATRELGQDHVSTVPAGDSARLATAINSILARPPSQSSLARARRRIVDEYGMSRVAERYGSVYDGLARTCAA